MNKWVQTLSNTNNAFKSQSTISSSPSLFASRYVELILIAQSYPRNSLPVFLDMAVRG